MEDIERLRIENARLQRELQMKNNILFKIKTVWTRRIAEFMTADFKNSWYNESEIKHLSEIVEEIHKLIQSRIDGEVTYKPKNYRYDYERTLYDIQKNYKNINILKSVTTLK